MAENTEKPKKKTGPKPKADADKRSERITILVRPSFKEQIQEAAKERDQTPSAFIVSAIKEKLDRAKTKATTT